MPRSLRRRLAYGFLALCTATSLSLSTAAPVQAWSWRNILRGGVQVLQGIQISNMSDAQEMEVGAEINQSLMSTEFKRFDNDQIQAYINAIGQRLVPHSTRPNLTYTFQVIESEQINAFATMGGYVYVTTGLLALAENEAEVAGVIGHEIGHIEGKHLINQIRETAIQRGVLTAAGIDRSTIAQLGVELALRRPNSRRDERDSDSRGLRMLGAAGYGQVGMASFMQKLANQGGSPPEFLSTHPSSSSRVADIERSIDPNLRQGDGLDPNAYQQQTLAVR
ncbi:MAG: M48 family metallopeptidase [Prochlorothrix sp.]